MFSIYRITTILSVPFILCYLKYRRASGKEDANRIDERLGKSTTERPRGKLIWLHAASVGESLSMIPLIKKLLSDNMNYNLMITTGTVSSANMMEDWLPQGAFHQYIPIDRPNYVQRFINYWEPDIAVWAESEFWPNMIIETHRQKIPLILVNGRISERSFSKWRRVPGFIQTILNCFSVCLGQSKTDVERLNQLGAKNTQYLGNLKFAAPELPADKQALNALRLIIGHRPCWLAASTHPGEEEIIAAVHKQIEPKHPELLTIIVPRHPARGMEILGSLQTMVNGTILRSRNDPINRHTSIYIADTLGELGLFYRLTETVFMGKSLVPLGGQNPLEALRLGCAVIHGPHMMNFQWMCEEMAKLNCSVQVDDGANLAETVSELLSNSTKRREMIRQGHTFVNSQSQVIDLVAKEINGILEIVDANT